MKNKFFDNLLKFAIGPLGAAFIGFITVPITTWLVAPEEFGMTTIFSLVQTLITSFIYLGIDQAYVREFHSYKGDKRNLLLNALIIPFMIAIGLMVIISLYSYEISYYLFEEINTILIFSLVVWIPFTVIERFILLNIRMEEKGLKYSLFNILVKLLVMILTILLLLTVSRTYTSIVLATLWGQIISDLIILIYSRKSIKLSVFKLDKQLISLMLRFGLPLLPAVAISWVLNSTDRLALEYFCSLYDIGIYFAAMKIVTALTMIQSIFATFWTPMAYRWHEEKVEVKKFTQVSYSVFILMGLMFIGILLFKKLFIWILSPDYAEAQYILPFLLFTPVMYTVSETTMLGINFSRKTHLSIWISLIAAVLNIVINLLLVPQVGAVGAAIGTGVSYIVFFWVRTIISRKNWYQFKLNFYAINILFLIGIAILNIVVQTNLIYMINISGIVLYLLINIPFIVSVYELDMKKLVNWKKYFYYMLKNS